MKNKNNLSYLKEQYLGKVQPLMSVDQIIDDIKNTLDVFEINEKDLNNNEQPHFKFLRLNFQNKYNMDTCNSNFKFYIIKKNERSMKYYSLMEIESERIIVVTESNVNLITSTCTFLSLELRIKRGLDKKTIQDENIELVEYLSQFELLNQINHHLK